MTDSPTESSLTTTIGLLAYYSYEISSQPQSSLLDHWLELYPADWVQLALIEALYRGRYKTICVGGLLADWERRGQPVYHFNREFEALICHDFPRIVFHKHWTVPSETFSKNSPQSALFITPQELPVPPTTPQLDTHHSQNPPLKQSTAEPEQIASSNLDTFKTSGGEPLWHPISSITPSSLDPDSLVSDTSVSVSEDPTPPSRMSSPKVDSIDRFTPDKEFSEHYQKLVGMVSKPSSLFDRQSTAIVQAAS